MSKNKILKATKFSLLIRELMYDRYVSFRYMHLHLPITELRNTIISKDANVGVVNTSDEINSRKITHEKRQYYLLLLIMILAISQIIIILSGSGISDSSQQLTLDEINQRTENISEVKYEFKNVMNSLEEFESTQHKSNSEENNEEKISIEKFPLSSAESIKSEASIEKRTIKPNKNLKVLQPVDTTGTASPIPEETNEAVAKRINGFIKYDLTGLAIADDSEHWDCVQDMNTGLMWEVKDQNNAMRNWRNQYSWYTPGEISTPGKPDGGRCRGGSDCDTNAYVQAMNERNYCGHNDWQIPTREQLQTLVDLSEGNTEASINKQYFPNTLPSWYWTSSVTATNEGYAWYVLFRNGVALSDLKERPKHIRLVRK